MSRLTRAGLASGACLLLLLIGAPLLALPVPARPASYVSDYAGLLSPAARQSLETRLADFERQTSNQVLVVIFPTLSGDDLESFSIRLAEEWKPGQKGRDNGALLLIFKNDRKIRIEVGYGLEGALTDAVSAAIIRDEIAPYFRAEKYEEGINRAVTAILNATRGEYHPAPEKSAPPRWIEDAVFLVLVFLINGGLAFSIILVLFVGGFALGVYALSLGMYKLGFFIFLALAVCFYLLTRAKGTERITRSGHRWKSGRGWAAFGGGSGSWGSGGGGGFSSGGGSFGGGGASGSW